MTAHHHHYLSQFYLKGFTNGGSKKSKLTVIDLPQKKHFETIPQNVGGLRDFNRLETLWYTYKQLYAPKLNFLFMDKGGEIINGSNLLKHIADLQANRQRSDPT